MSLRIGISLGDPAGIGPEVIFKAIPLIKDADVEFVLFCEKDFFDKALNLCPKTKETIFVSRVSFLGELKHDGSLSFGKPTKESGEFSYRSLNVGIDAALKGEISALATAPLSKEGLFLAGHRYSGHTEILAEKSGIKNVVMMFVAGNLRAVPLTRHIAISRIPKAITENLILDSIRIIAEFLGKYEGISKPKIGVLALNPHSGEKGLFGCEENILESAIAKLRSEAIDVSNPLVPDIAFIEETRAKYDVLVGMYHDQVLIPFKMLAFDKGVNATLGLPFIRTSPDHGTAFDIAGENIASPSSMIEAIKLAIKWARISAKE